MATIEDYFPQIMVLCKGVPELTAQSALVRAAREFASETRCVLRDLTITTEENSQNYSLTTDAEEQVINIKTAVANDSNVPPNQWPLTASDPRGWNAFISPGPPSNYAFIPYTKISLFPIPDTIYTIKLVVPVQPRNGASVLPDEIMTEWDQQICDGAIFYIKSIPNRPWTDMQGARAFRISFSSAMERAKQAVIRSFNDGCYIAKRRPFIV